MVVAANFTPTAGWPEFAPAKTGWNVIDAAPGTGAGAFAFQSDRTLAQSLTADILANEYRHYTVLLRRLANPNLPGPTDTNPYITIDMLDNVRVADRIFKADGSNTPRTAKMTQTGPGFDPNSPPAAGQPDLRPQSSGKIQPYAAFSAAAATGLLPFPNSMVQYQDPATVGVGVEGVRHTLTRQNSRADTRAHRRDLRGGGHGRPRRCHGPPDRDPDDALRLARPPRPAAHQPDGTAARLGRVSRTN